MWAEKTTTGQSASTVITAGAAAFGRGSTRSSESPASDKDPSQGTGARLSSTPVREGRLQTLSNIYGKMQ